MTRCQSILDYFDQGNSVAETARLAGVRYQHARNELIRKGRMAVGGSRGGRGGTAAAPSGGVAPPRQPRPLTAEVLLAAGFVRAACFVSNEGGLGLDEKLPAERGVYALCMDGYAQYVGVASRGVAGRLYNYLRPGPTQGTSIRINGLLAPLVDGGARIEVLVAFPADHGWNGLPVDGCTGLEAALISHYDLPWNIRGARRR